MVFWTVTERVTSQIASRNITDIPEENTDEGEFTSTVVPYLLIAINSNHTRGLSSGIPISDEQNGDLTDLTLLTEEMTTIVSVGNNAQTNEQNEQTLGHTNPFLMTRTAKSRGVCPDMGIKQVPEALVKCHCKGDEILANGSCQQYPERTFIDAEIDFMSTKKVPVAEYEVIIRDLECHPEKGRLLNFNRGQFRLRQRGDMILLESAGYLDGQRINNYCVTHHLDDSNKLTWTMKACIPVPSVPRCCPRGQAMKDGSCQPASTPELLRPPIGAKPFSNSIEWPDITNFLSPLTCTTDPVKTILHAFKKSNLVSLADGLQHGWIPGDINQGQIYYTCPKFCVDGIINSDGSVSYYTSFCYSNPKELHKKICGDRPCLRKCCKEGEIWDINNYACIPDPETIFNPQTPRNLSHYNIVTGEPLCEYSDTVAGPFTIDEYGFMQTESGRFPPTDYCVDTFLDRDVLMINASACVYETSAWEDVKAILIPVCYVISLLFLGITVACHLCVPEVQRNGGVHQLCHAIALSTAYISSFIVFVFQSYLIGRLGCFIVAIATQFGFLATFFWLNVMCFENWQKIRCLRKMLPSKPSPSWPYMLYAWGIPLLICVITVIMQRVLPEDVEGVIRPDIGISRCFFHDDAPYFAYFFGPVTFLLVCNAIFLGLTQFNFCMMLRDYENITKDLKDLGTGVISVAPKSTSSMPSRQITDHVNEYKQRLQLFVLMAICWVAEVLSWKIPPLELWAPTDTINALQGFFIFVIFLSNRNKRKILKKKYPRLYKTVSEFLNIPQVLKKCFCGGSSTSLSHVTSLSSSVSRKISSSTLISNFASTFRSYSSSTFSVNGSDTRTPRRSVSMDETLSGVVTLSHTSLRNTKSESGVLSVSC